MLRRGGWASNFKPIYPSVSSDWPIMRNPTFLPAPIRSEPLLFAWLRSSLRFSLMLYLVHWT